MKKSQLRNIIRESIKELTKKPLLEQTWPDEYHYWSICPFYNTGNVYINKVLFDDQYPSTAWNSSAGWFSTPAAAAASTAFYNLNGAPNVGEVLKFQHWWSSQGIYIERCWEYLGSQPTMVYNDADYFVASAANQLLSTHSNCNDCSLQGGGVPGCTDPLASNYNAAATQDDGSCIYPIPGCTDPLATNYNAAATVDDGSCTYPVNICNDQLWVNMPDGTPSNGGKINYCIRCSVNNNDPNSPNPQTSPEPLVWLSATPPYWNTSGPNATQNYCSCCPITWPPYYPMVAPSGNNTNITPAISKPKDKEIKQIDKPDPQIDRMKTLANIKPK